MCWCEAGIPSKPLKGTPDSAIHFPRVTSAGLSSLAYRCDLKIALGLRAVIALGSGWGRAAGERGAGSRGVCHAWWALPAAGPGEPSPLRHLHREPLLPVPGHSSGESRPGCSRCRHLAAPACQLLPRGWERCLPSRRLAQPPPGAPGAFPSAPMPAARGCAGRGGVRGPRAAMPA